MIVITLSPKSHYLPTLYCWRIPKYKKTCILHSCCRNYSCNRLLKWKVDDDYKQNGCSSSCTYKINFHFILLLSLSQLLSQVRSIYRTNYEYSSILIILLILIISLLSMLIGHLLYQTSGVGQWTNSVFGSCYMNDYSVDHWYISPIMSYNYLYWPVETNTHTS